MRSFEHGYFLETPLSHELLMAVRAVGEFRGRQRLYAEQSPEVLATLKRAAMVQSVEASNRIEGITVAPGRGDGLVRGPRREQEREGQRDSGRAPRRPTGCPLQAGYGPGDSEVHGAQRRTIQRGDDRTENRSAPAHRDVRFRLRVHPPLHGRQWPHRPPADAAAFVSTRL